MVAPDMHVRKNVGKIFLILRSASYLSICRAKCARKTGAVVRNIWQECVKFMQVAMILAVRESFGRLLEDELFHFLVFPN